MYERTLKPRFRPQPKPYISPIDSKKPANATLELQRRVKHLSQERQFITYDKAFRTMLGSDRSGIAASRTPVGRDRTHKRRISEEVEHRNKGCSYTRLHQRKVSLRKEQAWEDIKVAQALAVSKARSRSPVTLETEMDTQTSFKTRHRCNQSAMESTNVLE